jgi:hypothetical protein
MTKFLNCLLVVWMIAGINTYYGAADEVSDRDTSIRFEDDTAPIINCKTAGEDVASLQKQVSDIQTKLLKEEAGLVPPSDYNGDGIIDPEKDIEAGKAQQQSLHAQIDKIKQVCAIG